MGAATTHSDERASCSETEMIRALAVLAEGARNMTSSVGVRYAQRVQREFAAIETAHLANLDERDRRRASTAGGTRSRKESSRAESRSEAVNENPTLGTKLAHGDIGQEQLDAIADAARSTGGDAAKDDRLISEIENSRPDDATKIARRWLEERESDGAQSRYDRQNKRRKLITGHDRASGCDTLTLAGPTEKIAALKKRIDQRADEMYKGDGGRDVPAHKHPRTRLQRLFDAAEEILLAESSSRSNGATRNPHPKAMIHVSIVVDAEAEQQIRATCPDGSGYLPASVLERYGCDAMIAGTVYSESGEILWFGRQRRYATPAQFAALVGRDVGCVLCGRAPEFCEAHHMLPFNAPAQGETNIEDLALLCSSCHHLLHDSNHTLVWTNAPPHDRAGPNAVPRRVWSTRPATPAETPPRPNQHPDRASNQPTPETDRNGRVDRPAPTSEPIR